MKAVTTSRFRVYSWLSLIFLTASVVNWSCLSQSAESQVSQTRHATNSAAYIWPTQGKIVQGFTSYHEGIDIAAPAGTPIVAVKAGEVIKAGWNDFGLGNRVILKHPDGSETVYGHNRHLFVTVGQKVRQNQPIAEVGNTGNSIQPHLHFEVHLHGHTPVNPLSLLPSRANVQSIGQGSLLQEKISNIKIKEDDP